MTLCQLYRCVFLWNITGNAGLSHDIMCICVYMIGYCAMICDIFCVIYVGHLLKSYSVVYFKCWY